MIMNLFVTIYEFDLQLPSLLYSPYFTICYVFDAIEQNHLILTLPNFVVCMNVTIIDWKAGKAPRRVPCRFCLYGNDDKVSISHC